MPEEKFFLPLDWKDQLNEAFFKGCIIDVIEKLEEWFKNLKIINEEK